jgi:cytochrome c
MVLRRSSIAAIALLWQFIPAVAFADGNAEAGVKAFGLCANCHSLRPGVNMTGPSLAGVFGRKAGSLSSFPRYSAALAGAGAIWNEQTLDAWLADPAGFVPGNLMTIRGIADPKARADLIALLRLAGANGPTGAALDAPEAAEPELQSEPPDHQVRAIAFCGDTYRVTTQDGRTRAYWERNLRFVTDGTKRGPRPGTAAIMPAGMFGDRAFVIVAQAQDIGRLIENKCP